jgi:hypothetical protein
MNDNRIKKDLSGPWDAPLRDYVKSFPLMIIIYNLKKDIIEIEREIDYGNAEDRKFLGKITFWAIANERSVETISLKDYKKYETNR